MANMLAAVSEVTDEVFNVGSGVEVSLNELAQTLLRVMGSNLEPEYGPERSVNPVPRRLADTSKAERLLGFESSVGLEEGLRRLVEWWRAERAVEPSSLPSETWAKVPTRTSSTYEGRVSNGIQDRSRNDPDHETVARRGGGVGGRRGRDVRVGGAGTTSDGLRGGRGPTEWAPPKALPCPRARPPFTSLSWSLGVGPGDEVIVPSLSFIATANVVRHVGATPVFCDVDPATQNLTAETIEQQITSATRAVILVHQAGVPADIQADSEPLRATGDRGHRRRRVCYRCDLPGQAHRIAF